MSTFDQKVEEQFKNFDIDGSGFVSKTELYKVLKRVTGKDWTADEVTKLFDEVDTNHDDQMSLEELKKALSKRSPSDVKEADLRVAFNDIDKDKSGLISAEELQQLINKLGLQGKAAKYIELVDSNKDGNINFEEFLKAWKAGEKEIK
jgi:Ca2+-binding EF-hand superfamily protein